MQRIETIASQLGYRQHCHLEQKGDVAILVLHHGILNSLTTRMRASIRHYFRLAEANSSVRCIVLSGDGPCFSCGVDLSDFNASIVEISTSPETHTNSDNDEVVPSLSTLTNMIEASEKIVIAAIHGMAFSGGLELALAAHYRVAALTALFSFPEVQLGIIPCGGGTQRLPRLVGVRTAVDMISGSKKIGADAALKMGLIDDIVRNSEGKDKRDVVELAVRLVAGWKNTRRLSCDTNRPGVSLLHRTLLRWLEREICRKTPRGVMAPLRCLEAVYAAVKASSFANGLAQERAIFLKAIESPEARAMQYLMRASHGVLNAGLSLILRENNGMSSFQHICVVGGGTVGIGVVLLALRYGIPVTLVEINATERDRALRLVRSELDNDVKEGRLAPEIRARCDKILVGVTHDKNLIESLREVDIAIECVNEDAVLKRRVLARLDAACPPNCVIATSASSMSIGELANSTRRPGKVIGMHFIPPSDVTPLLEITQGQCTDRATVARVVSLGRRFHKSMIVVNDSFACVTTRIIVRALYQSFALLEEGAFPYEVDRAMRNFGFRLGPFAMDDLAGIDFTTKIRAVLQEQHQHAQRFSPAFFPSMDVFAMSQKLLADGRRGQKSGRGWHDYDDKGVLVSLLHKLRGTENFDWGVWKKGSVSLRRRPYPDRQVELMILDVCRKKKILRRDINEKEIVERILFAMLDEATKILSEGVVSSSATIDVAVAFGYSFPGWKGGLCYYADRFGLANVTQRMRIYNRAFGDLIFPPPCPQLLEMVAAQQTFSSRWP